MDRSLHPRSKPVALRRIVAVMKSHAQIPYLKEFIIFLAAAAQAVPMLQRQMSPVLG